VGGGHAGEVSGVFEAGQGELTFLTCAKKISGLLEPAQKKYHRN
jgi:hypothetical protein